MKCHNCGSAHIMYESNEDKSEEKYFCCVCGSDYFKYKDYNNDNAITETKTYNIGVKIWKEVGVKKVKMSFISEGSNVEEFKRYVDKAILKNKIEIAQYIIKDETKQGIYIKHDIIFNTKSYIKP